MDMPMPTAEHRRLHAFAGEWLGEEKMFPSPWGPGGPALGRSTSRVDLEGFFVIHDYIQEIDGRVMFRGHSVFGYDTQAKEYTWYWVDSMGQPPESAARGLWEGNTLTFVSTGPQGMSRYVYHFVDERTYTMRIEQSRDGGKTFSPFMDGTYRKK